MSYQPLTNCHPNKEEKKERRKKLSLAQKFDSANSETQAPGLLAQARPTGDSYRPDLFCPPIPPKPQDSTTTTAYVPKKAAANGLAIDDQGRTRPGTPPGAANATAGQAGALFDVMAEQYPMGGPKKAKRSKTTGDDGSFARFWQAYPKRVAKAAAVKAWEKIRPDAELIEIILRAVELQAGSEAWAKDNGKFIPYPASWLNAERWTDEIPQAQTGAESEEYTPGDIADQLFTKISTPAGGFNNEF